MNRRGFTLIELLVAILVLLAVLLASGQIFSVQHPKLQDSARRTLTLTRTCRLSNARFVMT